MNQTPQEILEARTMRLDVLTGLRWWAAFVVFLFHMRVLAPLPGKINQLADLGYLGVTFFFVLSGFVLTWSMRPGVSKSTFYWRRFARIWPSHIFALIIAIPVFYTMLPLTEGDFVKPFEVAVLLLSVVLLQGWFANPVILYSGNPAAWTLSVEALFYAMHPWIARLLVPLSRNGALLFGFVVMLWAFAYRAAVIWAPESWLSLVPIPLTRLPEFLLGMSVAWALRSGWRPKLYPVVGVVAVAVALGIMMAPQSFPTIGAVRVLALFGNELFTLATGVAIVSFSLAALKGKRSIFGSKLQVKLGTWSFAFYLVHATIIYLALRLFGVQPHSWANLKWYLLILAIDIALAWALYRFIEHPVEGRMRRWKDARDAARHEQTQVRARAHEASV